MKKIIFFLFVFFIILFSLDAFSQNVYKFRAKYFSSKEYNRYYGWGDWSEWEPANILIIIDLDDEKISVYANENCYFDIYEYDYDNDYNKKIINFYAVDEHGHQCRIRFIYYEYEDDRQLYIDYSNFIVAYTIYPR